MIYSTIISVRIPLLKPNRNVIVTCRIPFSFFRHTYIRTHSFGTEPKKRYITMLRADALAEINIFCEYEKHLAKDLIVSSMRICVCWYALRSTLIIADDLLEPIQRSRNEVVIVIRTAIYICSAYYSVNYQPHTGSTCAVLCIMHNFILFLAREIHKRR